MSKRVKKKKKKNSDAFSKKQQAQKIKKEKIRAVVHILSGIVAVVAFCVSILLSPIVKNFLISDKSSSSATTEATASTEPETFYAKTEKNYGIFFNGKLFYYGCDSSAVSSAKAKTDNNIKMTVTPMKGTSYSALCGMYFDDFSEIEEPAPLNTQTLYTAYEKSDDTYTTVVYCIDDGNGSSIELKYTYPKSDTQYKEAFELSCETFKVL